MSRSEPKSKSQLARMSKWIDFCLLAGKGKTNVWEVFVKDGEALLGEVRWFARWRCYAFFPTSDTVYEKQCLRDIANFCEKETKQHKNKMTALAQSEQSEKEKG